MDTNAKINQLVELMADLIPSVGKLSKMQERTNIEMHEMRTSNMKFAEVVEKRTHHPERTNIAIESLILKIDQMDDFGNRLLRVEKIILK